MVSIGEKCGNEVVHLLNSYEGNPAIYLPGASCVLAGKTYSPCSTTSNTDQRRQLSLLNPVQGQYYAAMAAVSDGGTRSYNALMMSIQRRQVHGMTVQANYTWSHGIDDGTSAAFHNAGGAIYERRRANRGNSELDRRHNFNLSTEYETPRFSNRPLRMLASGWQVSGIVRILSGSYMTALSGLERIQGSRIWNSSSLTQFPQPQFQTDTTIWTIRSSYIYFCKIPTTGDLA